MPLCTQCGEEKERIGQHFAMSNCDYPTFDKEIVDGILLGDGDIPSKNSNHCLRLRNSNKEWLDELSNKIRESYGPTLSRTAEELYKMNKESGFSEEPNIENYNDQYSWRTCTSVCMNKHRERWYGTGEKRVPNDLELTPTVLRHWIAGDGNLNWNWESRCFASVRLGRLDERDDEYLIKKLDNLGFSATRNGNHIELYGDSGRGLLDWSSPPPNGFEYKWCYDSMDDYERFK